jgi:hypothetical protein
MSRCAQDVPRKRLLSIVETVDEFGGTKWLWRSLIWGRQIQFVQIGRKHFLDRADIDDFIQKNKRMA